MYLPSLLVFSTFSIASVFGTEYVITHQVYFNITMRGRDVGRIVIGLFGDVVPKTVKNFYTIATDGVKGTTYEASVFHRVSKGFIIQGGDILKGDGTGSISIYGDFFDDENFHYKHESAGLVGMANAGKNTNGCQFYITTVPTPMLDGRNVVFGKVISGRNIVHRIEQTDASPEEVPYNPVIIKACGSIDTPKPFTISGNNDEEYTVFR